MQHVLYTDNWFTSPALLHALAQRGIRLCGSVRSNRKGMPTIPLADIRALGRGEWMQRQKGDATVAVWRDQRAMWLLYNHSSPGETASLERWNDAGRKVSVGCPRAIRDYFYGARYVDVLSQLHYAYLPGRKAMRLWPRLAWWLLGMCVINAFQLWSKGQQHLGQLRFREELMHEYRPSPPRASVKQACILLMRWPASTSPSVLAQREIVSNAAGSPTLACNPDFSVTRAKCIYASAVASHAIVHSCLYPLHIHCIVIFQRRFVRRLA